MTNEVNEMSAASRGSHGDTLSVLRTLIDGVRGMGLGDPESGGRVEASDVVRWAVDEIEQQRGSLQWLHGLLTEAEERLARLRLTDEERDVLELHAQRLVGWSRSSDESKKELVTVRGLLGRLS
jgi:hypothetical protein